MTHKNISFIKSAIRLIGYFLGLIAFPGGLIAAAFFVLIISEAVGIIEELNEK